MSDPAPMIAPAEHVYRGGHMRPDWWSNWEPKRGDILVSTPPKCGTTWTQTMLAMLIHGGPDLPAKLPVLSPWIDADLGVPASEVAAALGAQTGRRVVKTHTPADGFPIWDGVTVIAVYRHPLDLFFSLRKHAANQKDLSPDNLMLWPVADSLRSFVGGTSDYDTFGEETLMTVGMHYTRTALSGRLPDLKLFHYADMVRDGRRAVQNLARAAGIDADDALIDRVTSATAFGAMKARAKDYAPVAGTGFWKKDEGFFDSASSRKWEGHLSGEDLELYRDRLTELVPDAKARDWLESGRQ